MKRILLLYCLVLQTAGAATAQTPPAPEKEMLMREKIGRLRVADSTNTEVARCKIAKGDAQIEAAFLAGHGLVCVSDGKAFGF